MSRNLLLLTAVLVLGLFKFATEEKATAVSSVSLLLKSSAATNIEKEQFLDDRSSPVQLLKSYYNAINRQEYVRAYYYWDLKSRDATSQPPTYPQFETGYANTNTVRLTIGKVMSEGAAGTFYFQVPVKLVATHADTSEHTYVGCYIIRQPNPQNFGAPPFIPMSIYSAKIQEVSSHANTAVSKGC